MLQVCEEHFLIPVFVKLYGKSSHGLHCFVGDCHFHNNLIIFPGKCTRQFQAFSVFSQKPCLQICKSILFMGYSITNTSLSKPPIVISSPILRTVLLHIVSHKHIKTIAVFFLAHYWLSQDLMECTMANNRTFENMFKRFRMRWR